MKAQLRSTALAGCLLAPVAVAVSALPGAAFAQVTPEVLSFDIRSDGALQPGTRLRFRMEGTPHAQADARGFFEFSFRTPFPVPGTKYDVDIVARKADVTKEARLTLFQRQG